jgi:hypothetical protein
MNVKAPDFFKLAGAALIVLAFTVPMAYCAIQQDAASTSIRRACIEARGEWSNQWGGYCTLSKAQEQKQ